jgi:threonyl-tRNA synthetase
LQDFISQHLKRQGYEQVFTPHVGKLELYKTSGHFPYYQDSQYPPMVDHDQLKMLGSEGCSCGQLANLMREGTIEGYLLKPMNCPHHIKIYSSQQRSYRDLPIRLAEFGTTSLGAIRRNRRPDASPDLQDDAHCLHRDQVAAELNGCIELVIVFGDGDGRHVPWVPDPHRQYVVADN